MQLNYFEYKTIGRAQYFSEPSLHAVVFAVVLVCILLSSLYLLLRAASF
jgi:hypothetical protein